jgi:hypothetical protein
MEPADLIKRLRAPNPEREGSRGERWWPVVRDAISGDGGFAATLREAMTGAYGEADLEYRSPYDVPKSYVVRYPRERLEAYVRRVRVSTYVNYVAPVVREYAGHLSRRLPQRDSSTPAVAAWWADCSGAGAKVDAWMGEGAALAQRFGWAAAIFDRPAGDLSPSEARTFARWLQPEEIVDWDTDARRAFTWIRLGSIVCVRDPWTGNEKRVEVYTTWTPVTWRRITVERVGETDTITEDTGDMPHALGRVPVEVLYWSEPEAPGKLYGAGQVGGIVSLSLEHFNLRSELREWERGQCFGILCVQSTDAEVLQKIKVGVHGGIRVEPGVSMPSYVAPPVEVGAHLVQRIEGVVEAIYDAANLERTSGQQGDAQVSGVSRAYKFQRAGAQLRAFAANLQSFEQRAAILVGAWAGVAATARVQYPQDFDVADLGTTLTVQFDTLGKSADLVPEITRNARLTVARALNPDASPEQAKAIEAQVTRRYEAELKRFEVQFDPAKAAVLPSLPSTPPAGTAPAGSSAQLAGDTGGSSAPAGS